MKMTNQTIYTTFFIEEHNPINDADTFEVHAFSEDGDKVTAYLRPGGDSDVTHKHIYVALEPETMAEQWERYDWIESNPIPGALARVLRPNKAPTPRKFARAELVFIPKVSLI